MASSARIDELRKKFDENPRRYFAPLANEYRKAGDLEQAISICREYLPQQPGHMSGHIVYGQALFEKARFDESRHVFETALSLDPENLIALRHLGDIAREAGDKRTAKVWYQRVLEADPRNEEIAALMMSLLAPRASQPAVKAETDEPHNQVEKSQDLAIQSGLSSASTLQVPGARDRPPSERRPEHELPHPADFTVAGASLSEARQSVDVPAHVEGAGASALSESSSTDANESFATEPIDHEFLSALAAMSDDRVEPTPEAAHIEPPSSVEAVPIALEPAQVVEAFEHGVTPPIAGATPADDFDAYFATSAGEPATIAASSALAPNADPVQDAPSSEAVVTETMADVYLQQGHLDSALEIYKKLVSQRPDDARLQHRLRVLGEQIQRRAETTPAEQVRVTEGLTIRQFLVGIIAVGPTPVAASAAEGQRVPQDADRLLDRTAAALSSQSLEHLKVPTPVAQIASIDEDFGSTVPTPAVALHLESAEAAVEAFRVTLPTSELEPGRAPAASSKAAGDVLSFDRYFANDLRDGPAKSGTEPQMSPRQGADDIAQFNNWLNGLKKT
jgi:tetratricopeptide (TPR) repeat protein